MTPLTLIGLTAIAALVVAAIGVRIGRALLGRRREGHYEVLGALLQTGGTIHAVFLAFLVVAVWQSYDAARSNVADEASTLATLYRATVAMDPATGERMRQAARAYATAVIEREWQVQADSGGASETARAAGLMLYRVLGEEPASAKQVNGAADSAAFALLSQIQSDRNRRTLEAGQTLPSIIWLAAGGSGALILAMSFLLIMDQWRAQIAATFLLAGTIGLLLCTTLILSRPFSGPVAIGPDAFSHSLDVFASVDSSLR